MYLSKIEIFGFKSFPEKTVIEFSNGVSAIVGPNGSGKSNIVDAIRWVLGEQGDKALRSEKREDVVFSGTSKRKPLSVAEVSMTIQNNRNILPTEYSEVQIARRFFRSGETEYYLNGTKVRLKDIRHLFVDTGIGPDAYSVIELKMVETILSAVKNERRKMFEEAAGIVSYKQNRDLTYKKLETVHETLLRVNDIIREKQRNVNALERQAKKNEEAKNVFSELKILEISVYSYEYEIMLKEISEIKDHEHENISLKETLNSEIISLNNKSDELRDQVKSIEDKKIGVYTQLQELRSNIDSLERENLVNDQKQKNTEKNIIRLKSENEDLAESIRRNASKEEELKQSISVLNRSVEISDISLNEKKSKLDSSIELINGKRIEISELGNKLKEINKKVSNTRSEFEKTKLLFDNNLEKLERISKDNNKDLQQISLLENEKNELNSNLNIQKDIRKKTDSELKRLSEQKKNLETRSSVLEKEINSLKLEFQNKNNKISYLRNLTESFEDYSEGIQHLLKTKKIDDALTVIDIIRTEKTYKVAVETALGEISNYLILDDSRNLNKLISSLEEDSKGKVTFILNDKFLHYLSLPSYVEFDYSEPDFISENGVIGFADTLVEADKPEHKALIRYLLNEFIIVDNLDTAFRLSKDNYYKFITLNGDIVTNSVIRAGGSVKEENLKLGRDNLIESLESECRSLSSDIDTIEAELNHISSEINGIHLKPYQDNLSELDKKIIELAKEISIHDFKIDEITKSVTENDNIYKRIQEENKTLNESIDLLIADLSKSENEQSNSERELAFVSDEFSEIEKNYTEYLNDYNSFNIEITKLKSELKNEESLLNRIHNSREIQMKQIQKNQNQITDEELFLNQYKDTIRLNNDELVKLKAEKDSVNKIYSGYENEVSDRRSQQEQVELEQRTKRNLFDKVSQKLIDSQIKIRENEVKSEQFRDMILKKYEIDIANVPEEIISDVQNFKSEFAQEDGEIRLISSKKNIDELSERLKRLGGGFQQIIWDDFQNEKDELQKMIEQKNDLLESEKDIRKTIEKINIEARERFMSTFEQIRQNFIRIFKELFQEGDEANLKLIHEVDEDGKLNEDPLEAKIEITAKPRGKRPTSIELLSGGEKTLTAIALLFAIYLVKPSPFCILDEVDAPLDVANLNRFNNMIRKFSEKTQFILITHNERTMETVDILYGVTMQEPGVTTIVETRFKK